MQSLESITSLHPEAKRTHPVVLPFALFLKGIDRIFERVFKAQWNPLYRSGTLAGGLILVVMGTGLFLLFFYRLGTPYESVRELTEQWYFGRWLRAVHRYASDAAVVVVFFHALRMFVEGRSWGPRLLAWITGMILLGVLYISAITGYVLVWDQFGQTLAEAGARILDSTGILALPLLSAFSGVAPIPNSFFFMNLFLHVALPLAAILGLWLHTFRLARSVWLPSVKQIVQATLILIPLAIGVSAPLGKPAHLFERIGVIPLDAFFGFWIPFSTTISGPIFLAVAIAVAASLTIVPLFLKPARSVRPAPSQNQPELCEGCQQCVKDCPFDAITMVPRSLYPSTGAKPNLDSSSQEKNQKSEWVAQVNASLCVSCGICAASCSEFAIGPIGRKGRDQLTAIKSLTQASTLESSSQDSATPSSTKRGGVALLFCSSRESSIQIARELQEVHREHGFPGSPALCSVQCLGAVHAGVLTSILAHFDRLCLVGCPPDVCQFREGMSATEERIEGTRTPTLPPRIDRSRILLLSGSLPDREEFKQKYTAFVKLTPTSPPSSPSLGQGDRTQVPLTTKIRGMVTTTVPFLLLFGLIAAVSQIPYGRLQSDSQLRLSWRLPGQVSRICKDRTQAELEALPAHMRTPQDCKVTSLSYQLKLSIDDKVVLDERLSPKGLHLDRPLMVDRVLDVPPGVHTLSISLLPDERASKESDEGSPKPLNLQQTFQKEFKTSRILLITLDSLKQGFVVKE
jgi:ferredoxin